MLESYEGVISAETGHVAVHEGGAIEYSGHKVLTIPSSEGKSLPTVLKIILKPLIVILNVIIWSFLVWYTFPILLNTVHYIQK